MGKKKKAQHQSTQLKGHIISRSSLFQLYVLESPTHSCTVATFTK